MRLLLRYLSTKRENTPFGPLQMRTAALSSAIDQQRLDDYEGLSNRHYSGLCDDAENAQLIFGLRKTEDESHNYISSHIISSRSTQERTEVPRIYYSAVQVR